MSRLKTSNKKVVIYSLAIVLLILGVAIRVVLVPTGEEEVAVSSVNELYYDACLNDTVGIKLKTDFPRFTSASIEAMKDLVEEIENKKDVEKAINCQYVLARTSAFRGDLTKSISHYQNVLNLYESGSKWVDVLVGVETPEEVRAVIVSYQKAADALIDEADSHRVIWRQN